MEVNIRLFPAQRSIIKATEANIVAVLSRGYGKSYSLAFWCLKKLITDSYTGLLICPTYQQLRETVKYLIIHSEAAGIEYSINTKPSWCSSPLSDHKNIFCLNIGDGKLHYIKLCSGDNPESVRGSSADFIAYDECALLKEEIVDIATPCLRGRGPKFTYQQLFATTPRDTTNWLYKRYVEKQVPSTVHIKAPALENFLEFTDQKLQYYRSILTEMMWKREILAEWVDMASNAMFYAFDKEAHVADKPLDGRIFLSCDQNNINLESICGVLYEDKIHVSADIQIPENGDAVKVATEFHKKFQSTKNRQVWLMGDRYGHNNSLTSKTTYYQQLAAALKRLGWSVKDITNKKNPNVWDSAQIVNKLFEDNRLSIAPAAVELIRHLKEVKWKDDEFVMNKKLLDSGLCDCLRYVSWTEFGKSNVKSRSLFA